MRADIRALLKQLAEFEDRVVNGHQQQNGQLAEFGAQLYGIHIVQEMLCEKLGITDDEVKARVEAHKAMMLEQDARLREAAEKARDEALAEKARQKAERAEAETPEVQRTDGEEMPLEYAFTMPGPAITGAHTARTTEPPAPPAEVVDAQAPASRPDEDDQQG